MTQSLARSLYGFASIALVFWGLIAVGDGMHYLLHVLAAVGR